MKNAFIIHGAYGNPEENWITWLKQELENIGIATIVPKFPTPEGQNLENWMKAFEPFKKQLNHESIIIGHSIGVAFILRVLESIDVKIKAAFLVAGFLKGIGDAELDAMNETFYGKPFDWKKIRKNCREFVCYSSDNDPFVPLWQGQEVADGVGVEISLVKGAGHFNTKAGYTKFPLLLERIRSLWKE